MKKGREPQKYLSRTHEAADLEDIKEVFCNNLQFQQIVISTSFAFVYRYLIINIIFPIFATSQR
jgi:hypothetical protein